MTLRILRVTEGKAGKMLDLALDPGSHRTGDIWHIEMHRLKDLASVAFCWLAAGPLGWRGATRFAAGSPLLDPHAEHVVPVQLPEEEQNGRTVLAGSLAHLHAACGASVQSAYGAEEQGREEFAVPKDMQAALRAPAQRRQRQQQKQAPHTSDDAQKPHAGDAHAHAHSKHAKSGAKRPRISTEGLAVLEIDPFTFAQGRGVEPERRGKWLGVLDRLAHLQESGANAVLLPSPLLRGPGLGVQVRRTQPGQCVL